MPGQLFPKQFINASLEHYTFRISRKSSAIYVTILVFIIALVAALPLIQVPVFINSQGLISTHSQRYQLSVPISGLLISHQLNENRLVSVNDTLLELDQSVIKTEINQVRNSIDQLNEFIADLDNLVVGKTTSILSDQYQLDLVQYETSLSQLNLKKEALKAIHDRQQKLFGQKVIAAIDYEKAKTDYDQILAEIAFFRKQARNIWKQKSLTLTDERNQLSLKEKQLLNELPKYVLTSPVKGELQNVSTVSAGQLLTQGQKLAELSPDTSLLAICYLSPKDVGLIRAGMKASFRIDAYNFNDWGLVQGTVSNISSDAYIINNQSFFKVECTLDQDHLSLKNGFVGKFRKGMTLQVNFTVSNRTLYQLLYDKIDDWINPSLS